MAKVNDENEFRSEHDVVTLPPAAMQQIARKNGAMQVRPDMPLIDCPTNLDLRSERGKALAFNALGEPDYEISASEPTRMVATNYLVYPAEKVDEDSGEVHVFSYLVLFSGDGRFVKTTSDVVKARIGQSLGMYSEADWAKGIPLVIQPVLSRRTQRTYHSVKIDTDANVNL